jgi:hypothetical protein
MKLPPTTTLKARALEYAAKGLAVLPMHTTKDGVCSCSNGTKCGNPGKHPWNLNGVKGASTNRKQIREWWTAHPEANIGIACGIKSNILALDVDPRNGGEDSLDELKAKHGKLHTLVHSIGFAPAEELKNDFVFALSGYRPDVEFFESIGIQINPVDQKPTYNKETLESNIPGIYLAGVVVAGKMTNEVFIENGRFHGEVIIRSIRQSLAEAEPRLSRQSS